MVKALIAGGGVAGPVTAMALQRAGIDAVVYEAHAPAGDDAGSYLTVASNGLDALRAVEADKPVLAAGFPTPTNVLFSGTGRRLGAVGNGGRLADGTVSRRRSHHGCGCAVMLAVDELALRVANNDSATALSRHDPSAALPPRLKSSVNADLDT